MVICSRTTGCAVAKTVHAFSYLVYLPALLPVRTLFDAAGRADCVKSPTAAL
jgi:hypothetical protein